MGGGGGGGDIGVCSVAVLLSFLCSIPVNKIPHFGIVAISNPVVCDVCTFQPTVFSEAKLVAVLQCQQYHHHLHVNHAVSTVYLNILSHVDVFTVQKKKGIQAMLIMGLWKYIAASVFRQLFLW